RCASRDPRWPRGRRSANAHPGAEEFLLGRAGGAARGGVGRLRERGKSMCGLAGFVGTRSADPALLERMSSAIVHRGPDDSGTWIEDNVGLALRRLAIIDLSSAGHQPMVSRCGRYVIAFNGEIYNHPELRDALAAEGVAFDGRSDTEVLLSAFRVWGR